MSVKWQRAANGGKWKRLVVISYAGGALRCTVAGKSINDLLRPIMIDRSLMSAEVEANGADALYLQLLVHRKTAECDALHQNRPLLRLDPS